MPCKPLMPVFQDEKCFICGDALVAFIENEHGFNYLCSNNHNNQLEHKNKSIHYVDAMLYSSNPENKPISKLLAAGVWRSQLREQIHFPQIGLIWKYLDADSCSKDFEEVVIHLAQIGIR